MNNPQCCPITEIANEKGLFAYNLNGSLVISIFPDKGSIKNKIERFEKVFERKAKSVIFVSSCVSDMRLAHFYRDPKAQINSYFFGIISKELF